MNCKIDRKNQILVSCNELASISDIQNLLFQLNKSLIELKKEKDEYQTRIDECRGLCIRIKEIMDATTTRFFTAEQHQL